METIKTPDLALIAAYQTFHVEPLTMTNVDGQVFVEYENNPRNAQIYERFFGNTLPVPSALEYANNYKAVKNRIYKVCQPKWYDPKKARS